jgi:hypothetical protein
VCGDGETARFLRPRCAHSIRAAQGRMPRQAVTGVRLVCGRLSTAAGGSTGDRAVAQFGSALDWGSSGRRFKSCQPDTENML